MSTSLGLEEVAIRRGRDTLLALDATVSPGEILTVMGPSGSGKSTLLAAIVGALDPAFALSGRILLDNRDITLLPPQAREVGILFQDELLFPHLSVAGNIAFGLAPSLKGRAARRARIEAALAEVGLEGLADRDPATLSGGQRARVALLRTLLSAPRALLLDEPFSSLDAETRRTFRDTVFSAARTARLPVLLVTHDHGDAEAAGGPVIDLRTPPAPGASTPGRTTND